jgi:hypothetical protein
VICVIPSAGRASTMETHKLFRQSFVCVPESQAEEYRKYHPSVVAHPDTVYGMGQKRQWILDNFDDDIIFMADDDIECLVYMGGEQGFTGGLRTKVKDPDRIWEVLLNTAHIARDTGTNLFGFNEIADIRKFDYLQPFSTRDRINGFAMGIIKDGQRFDPRLVVKQDYDFFLMSLYWKRFIWRDDRYAFLAKHYTNKGGLCAHRSTNKEIACINILQQKFGKQVVGTVKDKPWKVVIKKL